MEKLFKLAREIAAQDEFTGATPDNLALWQAYNLINSWRELAREAIEEAKRHY